MTRSTPGASRVKVKHTLATEAGLSCAAQSPDALRHWRCSSPFLRSRPIRHPGLPLTLEADLPLPGDSSRFDYESYDARRHLLFIAHLGQSELLVFDTRTRQVIKRNRRPAARARRTGDSGARSCLCKRNRYRRGRGDRRRELDRGGPDAGGTYPDGMAYAPQAGKLYVSDETGETETVIDVRPISASRRFLWVARSAIRSTIPFPGTST